MPRELAPGRPSKNSNVSPEFCPGILPECVPVPLYPMYECENIAEIIRHSAEIKRYSDGKTKLQVTVSLGISSLQENSPANPDKLLSQANQALYKDKENGRNRVESYVAVGDR